MDTHRDEDFKPQQLRRLFDEVKDRPNKGFDMQRLRERAGSMTLSRENTITSGGIMESPLREWTAHGFHVTELPPDEQGVLRISIGGLDGLGKYCTFRGERTACVAFLEEALKALLSPR